MNDDSNPESLPTAVDEERPAPARKRARRAKVAVAEGTSVTAGEAVHDSQEAAQGLEAEPPPSPARRADEAASVAIAPVVPNDTQPTVDAEPAAGGERPKRPRRRGRRGKEGREGKPGAANAAAGLPSRNSESGAPAARPELEPQARERLGETFAHVTSDGYDEDSTPTDEELRDLEERAQVLESPAQAETASVGEAEGVPAVPGMPAVSDDEAVTEGGGADASGNPDRRVLAPQRDAPKLQKVLAQSGAGSRRDIEQWIAEGRVSVNGKAAHTGQRVSFGDRVAVDGKPVRIRIAPLPARVIAYHKPVGEIVTHDDPQQRPTVFRKLPRLPQGKWQSVGRLDINTEGLLLFTNSGELANQLMHPRFGIEREYAVRVLGSLGDEARAKLLEGVDVEGQRAAFLSIDEGSGEGVNRWYRVTIAEGRHREVRRLFDAVGLAVSRLIRIRYGAVVLPRGLKRGVWVDLPEGDVKSLRRMVGIGDRAERGERAERSDRGGRNDDGRGGKDRRGRGSRGGQGQGRPPQDGRGANESRPPRDGRDASRDPRGRRGDRQGRGGGGGQRGEGAIPNPLMQTYDRRAGQEARRHVREYGDDGPIPNPLQQNYDQRALRESNRTPRREYGDDGPIPNPLQQNYDKRQIQGRGDSLVLGRRQQRQGQSGQPDPMQTAVGYIGADAFHTKTSQGRGNKGQGGRRRR